jgi:alpha-N-acetylglucosaminidase
MAAAGVGNPYRMVSYNDAVFGRAGGAIAVKDGTVAQIPVTSQDATGSWARAGLIVRNDLGTQGSAGHVNLAITPSNGCG